MNHSALSMPLPTQTAALKQGIAHAIRCWLWALAVLVVLSPSVWAANGRACLPNGFNSFSPISPNVVSLKRNSTNDQLLYTQTVIDNFSGSQACTSNTDAELSFMFLPSALFVTSYNNVGFVFTANINTIQNSPTSVKVGYQLRTNSPDQFSNSYSLYVNYFIIVKCAGGLGVNLPSSSEARITGVNSTACKGNYSVTTIFEIYQNGNIILKSGYVKVTNTNGIRVRVSLYSGATQTNTALTMIPGSDSTVFQTNVSCAYSLTSSSLNLGSFTDVQIYRQNVVPVAFTIKTSNCTNITTGGGNTHGMYVYWNFDAVDPYDSTILANTSTGSNASVNVGARISCNNGDAVAQDNTIVNMIGAMAASNSFPCVAYLVPMSIVGAPEDIGPGNFTSRATLTFQFD